MNYVFNEFRILLKPFLKEYLRLNVVINLTTSKWFTYKFLNIIFKFNCSSNNSKLTSFYVVFHHYCNREVRRLVILVVVTQKFYDTFE